MARTQRSAQGLTIEGITALLVLAVLLFLFSTSLWISIPPSSRVQVGDFVVTALVVLFAYRAEKLVAPLSATISLGLQLNVQKVSVLVQGFLRFLYLAVAYFSLRGTSIRLLTLVLDNTNAHVVYDAVFTVLILLNLYDTVKKSVT